MLDQNENLNGITANISGLKCDGPTCDYEDPAIKVEDYEQYIDKPCPKCGASLVAMINDMPDASEPGQETASIQLDMNGTGDVAILSIQSSKKGDDPDGES